jgi:hypothetical protein
MRFRRADLEDVARDDRAFREREEEDHALRYIRKDMRASRDPARFDLAANWTRQARAYLRQGANHRPRRACRVY